MNKEIRMWIDEGKPLWQIERELDLLDNSGHMPAQRWCERASVLTRMVHRGWCWLTFATSKGSQ